MTLEDWFDASVERFRRDGLQTGLYGSAQELWQGSLGKLGEYYNYGTHVYEYDWDLLLILDTCRPDGLAAVASEYDFLDGYDPETEYINSVGSRSPEWIAKTFDPDSVAGPELSETAYVSANPHTRDLPDPNRLGLVDEVWTYGWSTEFGTVEPETVADRVIDVHRQLDFERHVAHFMQPHSPYRSLVTDHPEWFCLDVGLDNPEARPDMIIWERLRTGRISREELWEAYLDNIRWVLDAVEIVLSNVDADDVVISSDHGEGFGEYWFYGHSSTAPIPVVKQVPWHRTEATDEGTYEPTVEPENVALADDEVAERLRNLGYV